MGCAKQGKKPDKECKEEFNGCSMIAMGMAPPSTTELPELPDFLKPTSKPTIRPVRPISDIDLPEGPNVIQPSKEEEPETEEDKGILS